MIPRSDMKIRRLLPKRTTTNPSDTLNDIGLALASGLSPPERITVTEAAEKYVVINQPGAYIGPYRSDMTPYMEEPADTLASREFSAVVFAGSAQSGKTQSLLLNWLAYNILSDPMDMIFYSPSHSAARDFAVRRIDRLHRHSKEVGALLSPRADDDNRHDKQYRNGVMLTLSWPSVTEFAGRPVGRVALTDFDRMDDNIGGDGNPFDLASMRTTTFGSFRMTLAESSPSRPLEDPRWTPSSPHEAPPVTGILGLYNRGDRRRFYWPCPRCNARFEGTFHMLKWADSKDRMEASESVYMPCPKCEYKIDFSHRSQMNIDGVWLRDGQFFNKRGFIRGTPIRSDIASFWLNGAASTFVSWPELVRLYLTAEEEYTKTQNEDSLRKFYNNNLAEPYVPKRHDTTRLPTDLKMRAEDYGFAEQPEVPSAVRTLIAVVDVQKNMFIVQVYGIAPGKPFDVYVVDRFDVRKSNRLDEDGERAWVKPGSYLEDWYLLTEQVLTRTYPIEGTEARMQVRMTFCDSGGREGVTTMAYAYYRKLRSDLTLMGRFHLVKGEPNRTAPYVRIGHPDSQTRATGTKAGAQGDVPVLFINSTIGKDVLHNRLDAVIPGSGMFHFPKWLPDWFFAEMCAEVRTPKGWEVARGGRQRNEAWDLSYYLLAGCNSSILNLDRVDWNGKVPAWADVHNRNPMVTAPEKQNVAAPETPGYKIRQYGSILG